MVTGCFNNTNGEPDFRRFSLFEINTPLGQKAKDFVLRYYSQDGIDKTDIYEYFREYHLVLSALKHAT